MFVIRKTISMPFLMYYVQVLVNGIGHSLCHVQTNALYDDLFQGPNLYGVMSTGEMVWELVVTGQLFDKKWTAVALRWKKPDLTDTGKYFSDTLFMHLCMWQFFYSPIWTNLNY